MQRPLVTDSKALRCCQPKCPMRTTSSRYDSGASEKNAPRCGVLGCASPPPPSPEVNVVIRHLPRVTKMSVFFARPHPRPHNNIEQKGQGVVTGRHRNIMERSVFFARTGLPNFTAGSNAHHGAGHGIRRVTRSEEPCNSCGCGAAYGPTMTQL